ncbi:MAG: PspC domain-containing protein [Myxococcaceae bacterium]
MTTSKPFHRAHSTRVLGGVCSAVADQMGLDVAWVRMAFVLGTLITGGLAFWAYFALWGVTPASPTEPAPIPRLIRWVVGLFTPSPGGDVPTVYR